MPAKMRLQRHGKKGQPFYHIVIADARAPRDGRFTEKIGTYNPVAQPAQININFDKALDWLNKGAQPTDTVRSILSQKGVLLKKHLLVGVKKGAMTAEQAEVKFQNWMKEKEAKAAEIVKTTAEQKRAIQKERLEAEAKVNEARIAELAKRRAEAAAGKAAAEADPEGKAEGCPGCQGRKGRQCNRRGGISATRLKNDRASLALFMHGVAGVEAVSIVAYNNGLFRIAETVSTQKGFFEKVTPIAQEHKLLRILGSRCRPQASS